MENPLKKLAGQTAIYGVSSIIGRFLNYLLVPLYVYTFKPAEYGIVIEFYAYVVVLQIILTYGMETGFFRFSKKKYDSHTVLSTVITSITSTSTLFFILILIFSDKISAFLGYENNTYYVTIFALILSVDAISAILFANLRRLNKAKKFAILKLLNISVNIALNLFFILLCPYLVKNDFNFIKYIYNPNFGVGYIFLSNLFASIFVLILLLPDIFKIKYNFDYKLLKKILIYSLPLLLTGLTGAVNEMADKVLIKHWTVVPDGIKDADSYVLRQLGLYGANSKLAVVMMMFVQAFRYAAEPFFFSYNKKSKQRLKIFADVMKYYVIFAFIMFLFIMLNLDIFKYFIGTDYFEGLNVVFPLFLSRFLVGVFFVLSFWYKLHDVTSKAIVIFSTGAIVTIVMDYFLIPEYGYIAAAWTNFTAYLVMVVFSYLWSRRYMKINFQYFRIFFYVAAPLLLYFFSKMINFTNNFVSLSLKNAMLIIYIFVVLKVEKITINDIKKLVPKKLKNETKNN